MKFAKGILLAVTTLLCCGQYAVAQVTESDLQEFFGESAVAQMTEAGTWEYEVFRQTQAFYTQDVNGRKDISGYPDINVLAPISSELGVLDLSKIENGVFLAQYNIPVDNDRYGYYKIGDTDILFIVYPEVLIQKLYERQNP